MARLLPDRRGHLLPVGYHPPSEIGHHTACADFKGLRAQTCSPSKSPLYQQRFFCYECMTRIPITCEPGCSTPGDLFPAGFNTKTRSCLRERRRQLRTPRIVIHPRCCLRMDSQCLYWMERKRGTPSHLVREGSASSVARSQPRRTGSMSFQDGYWR